MAAAKDAMLSKMTNIVRKYVSKDGLDDETLAEYLGDTVNKDYKVCFFHSIPIQAKCQIF